MSSGQRTTTRVSYINKNPQFYPMVINSTTELDRELRRLYFYDELIKGEHYINHFKRCKNYFKILKLKDKNLDYKDIGKILNLPKGLVYRYIKRSKPYLYHLALSMPDKKLRKGYKLLPLRAKKGGCIYYDYIEVPIKIKNYKDVLFILKQLGDKNISSKKEAFAYILGFMISDTSKPKGYRFSNQFLVSLSRKNDCNLQIGKNICKYFNLLGIKARRINDDDRIDKLRPNGHYRFISEKSPFIRYLIKSCLKLKNNQLTTYDKVKMEWLLKCPKDFIINFLQGAYDGDGCAHNFWRVELSCDPNQDLFLSLLTKLGIISYKDGDAISISNEKSILKSLKLQIFKYETNRLKSLERLSSKIGNRILIRNLNENVKEEIIRLKVNGMSGGEVSEYIFNNQGIGIHPNSINELYRNHLYKS